MKRQLLAALIALSPSSSAAQVLAAALRGVPTLPSAAVGSAPLGSAAVSPSAAPSAAPLAFSAVPALAAASLPARSASVAAPAAAKSPAASSALDVLGARLAAPSAAGSSQDRESLDAAFAGAKTSEKSIAPVFEPRDHAMPPVMSASSFSQAQRRAVEGARLYRLAYRAARPTPAVANPERFYSDVFGIGQLLWTRTTIGSRFSKTLLLAQARGVWRRHFGGANVGALFEKYVSAAALVDGMSPNHLRKGIQGTLLEASLSPNSGVAAVLKTKLAELEETRAFRAETGRRPLDDFEAAVLAALRDGGPSFHVAGVIVTGSYVYGQPHPGSDLDVYVLTDGAPFDGAVSADVEEFIARLEAARLPGKWPAVKDIRTKIYAASDPKMADLIREFPSEVVGSADVKDRFAGKTADRPFWSSTPLQRLRHRLTEPMFRLLLRRRLAAAAAGGDGDSGAPVKVAAAPVRRMPIEDFLRVSLAHEREYAVEVMGRTMVVHPQVVSPKYSFAPQFMIKHWDVKPGMTVLDMGTGSGILALFAADRGASRVLALDLNPFAVDVARRNMALNGVDSIVEVRASDLFSAAGAETFDRVIFNVPFFNKKADPTVPLTLGVYDEGYQTARKFLTEAHTHLRPNGKVLLGYSRKDETPFMERIIRETGYRIEKIIQEPGRPMALYELTPSR
ncbi:MAG: methyltransferase [Elusimicrobiota bacterium]